MQKRKKVVQKPKKPLDTLRTKPARGRPSRVPPSEIIGRANHLKWILNEVWSGLWPLLSRVQSKQDVINAFEKAASSYEREFMPHLAELVLQVLHEPGFPKKQTAQMNFLADSLAGYGSVSPRRSRDICQRERATQTDSHHIIQWEVYIECSCGFKGHSINHGCPRCGARIYFDDLSDAFSSDVE